MRNAGIALVVVTLVLALLASRMGSSSVPTGTAEELARLRYANSLMTSKLEAYEVRLNALDSLKQKVEDAQKLETACRARNDRLQSRITKARQKCEPGTGESRDAPPPNPPPPPSGHGGHGNLTAQLLHAHSRWDWRAIVKEMMQPWPRIELAQLDTAIAACNDNGTMYCQRMQIIKGSLYINDYRAIFFDRHYAPARVMPILETLRRHPNLPDMDIVVAGNDEPRVPAVPGDRFSWSRTCGRWPGDNTISGASGTRKATMPPAIFASTINRAVFDLPWLDFAWFFPRRQHKLRTPPWSKLHPSLVEAGGSVSWGSKTELAMHTGNVGSPYRKMLSAVATQHPQEVLVHGSHTHCPTMPPLPWPHGRTHPLLTVARQRCVCVCVCVCCRSSSTSSSSATTAGFARRARSSGCTSRAASSSTSAT